MALSYNTKLYLIYISVSMSNIITLIIIKSKIIEYKKKEESNSEKLMKKNIFIWAASEQHM